jgi:hypothetical protein
MDGIEANSNGDEAEGSDWKYTDKGYNKRFGYKEGDGGFVKDSDKWEKKIFAKWR